MAMLQVEVPDAVFNFIKTNQIDFITQAALLLYPKVYTDEISLSKVANLLNIGRPAVMAIYERFHLPYLHFYKEDLDEELKMVDKLFTEGGNSL